MKRTQIQLPDRLFSAARDLATTKEISLAELVRRGLEYMLAVTPKVGGAHSKWELPRPHTLESSDPFTTPDWREQLHTERLNVAENGDDYRPGRQQ